MANRFKLRKSWRKERSSSAGWAGECVRSWDSCWLGTRGQGWGERWLGTWGQGWGNKTMSEIINVEAVQEESFAELLEQSIKTLNTGDKVMGIVTGIGNTEVQVDLGTKHAGYIPYDEVSADPSVKPEDILNVGDEIEVFVVRVNDQEGTVQLSKKKLDGLKVWDDMANWVEDKTTVEGVITEENKGGLVANVKGIREIGRAHV